MRAAQALRQRLSQICRASHRRASSYARRHRFDHHEIPVELRIAMQFLALRKLVARKRASCNLIGHGVGELLDFLRNRLYTFS